MFANFLIGLREGIEAALIVSILVAYVVKLGQQHLLPRLWAGVVLAIALSVGFAALLAITSNELSERAEQIFAGTTSLAAVALITWMIFWMAKRARFIKGQLQGDVDAALEKGSWALAIIAFVAVIREGLETALFLYAGISASGGTSEPVIGALLGLLAAVIIGVIIYRGAVSLDLAKLFRWTGFALIIVAAGLLAYAVHEYQEAGLLPGEDNVAFDISSTIPPESWYGSLLKGVLSFRPVTTWLEIIVWWAYAVPVLVLFLRRTKRPAPVTQKVPQPV